MTTVLQNYYTDNASCVLPGLTTFYAAQLLKIWSAAAGYSIRLCKLGLQNLIN